MNELRECEVCGRTRPVKHLQRAVYVYQPLQGAIRVQGQADAYRCAARAQCKAARRAHSSTPSSRVCQVPDCGCDGTWHE